MYLLGWAVGLRMRTGSLVWIGLVWAGVLEVFGGAFLDVSVYVNALGPVVGIDVVEPALLGIWAGRLGAL